VHHLLDRLQMTKAQNARGRGGPQGDREGLQGGRGGAKGGRGSRGSSQVKTLYFLLLFFLNAITLLVENAGVGDLRVLSSGYLGDVPCFIILLNCLDRMLLFVYSIKL
jgi:hypothetical protein